MNVKSIIFLFPLLLISCGKECNLKPIPDNILDLKKIKEKNIINCGNEIDTLVFIDEYDIYEKESYKGLMKYVECGHGKSYTCDFKNEPISVSLDKTEKKGLELSARGWFNNLANEQIVIVTENELLKNTKYRFKRNTNDSAKSQIKEVILNGWKIESIITVDNKKWNLK
jgi:hypothetical protein